MALYYYTFNTIDEVAKHYDNIKPMVSKNHTKEQDVRPIGDRRRKQERIVKQSDNCYLFLDWDSPDNLFWYSWYKDYDPGKVDAKQMKDYAAMVWERKRDGTEVVRIRNGIGNGAHNSRYKWLARIVPKGLFFRIQNGKQYVVQGYGVPVNQWFLPKGKYNHPAYVEAVNKDRKQQLTQRFKGLPDNFNFHRQLKKTGKNPELVLTRKDPKSDWQCENEHSLPRPPRQVVLKGTKAKYKKAIDSFRDYTFAVAPVLVLRSDGENSYWRRHDWDQERSMRDDFREAVKKDPRYTDIIAEGEGRNYFDLSNMPHKLAISLITSYNDSVRMYLAYQFGISSDICYMETQEDVSKVKGQFNRWINKICGFTKTVG